MKRMSLGERIKITKRGFGILKKYCPGLAEQKALYEIIHSLQPFISIWFSARIVDELINYCRKEYIATYVISIIVINFICTVSFFELFFSIVAENKMSDESWD